MNKNTIFKVSTLTVALMTSLPSMAYTIESDAGNAELYGIFAVSYDSIGEQNMDRISEFSPTRSSEIGLAGAINSQAPFTIGYDIQADFKEAGSLRLTRLNAKIGTSMGEFTVGRAANQFDLITKEFDAFDGQFSKDFELGDGVRNLNSLSINLDSIENVNVMVDIGAGHSSAQVGDLLSIGAKYKHSDIFSVAAAYERDDRPQVTTVDGSTTKITPQKTTDTFKVGAKFNFYILGSNKITSGTILTYEDNSQKGVKTTLSQTIAYDLGHKFELISGLAMVDEDYETPNAAYVSRIGVNYQYKENITAYAGFAHDTNGDASNSFMHSVGVAYVF